MSLYTTTIRSGFLAYDFYKVDENGVRQSEVSIIGVKKRVEEKWTQAAIAVGLIGGATVIEDIFIF